MMARFLGTYLHGPLLPKNPEVADFVISKAIQKRNPNFKYSDLKPLEDKFETMASRLCLKN